MLIAVIGGKLQGVEAVYLAQMAGYKTLVIDKNPEAPAVGLCDYFLEFEFCPDAPFPSCNFQIDLILPAIEDNTVLSLLQTWSSVEGIPLAFDRDAYSVSISKLYSNLLFERLNIPVPKSWPGCTFPVVVKPDQASGSQGVKIIDTPASLSDWVSRPRQGGLVIQEFVDGPSYSIEVLGCPGNYRALQVTDLGMDKDWDCKNVTAPSQLSADLIAQLKKMAVDVAQGLRLTGIMDLETIFHNDGFKILEIDARLPSQTPIAVYWSTHVNMVKMLVKLILHKKVDEKPVCESPVLVEHIKVCGTQIEFSGEHIMAEDGHLRRRADFFGANDAITSFGPDKKQWVATMIFTGVSKGEIDFKRSACYDKIINYSRKDIMEPNI